MAKTKTTSSAVKTEKPKTPAAKADKPTPAAVKADDMKTPAVKADKPTPTAAKTAKPKPAVKAKPAVVKAEKPKVAATASKPKSPATKKVADRSMGIAGCHHNGKYYSSGDMVCFPDGYLYVCIGTGWKKSSQKCK